METNKHFAYERLLPTPGKTTRYLRLPFDLLLDCLDSSKWEASPTDAFIQLLGHVNYEDHSEGNGEAVRLCRRGESFRSLQAWSEIFHWTKSKTRRYLQQLEHHQVIELESLGYTTRLRVLHYEFYMGKIARIDDKPYPVEFETFWETFHRTTQTPAVDKVATFRAWRKLTIEERDKATKKVTAYYYSLSKTSYCAKAVTYLQNKKFNNQFHY